MKNFVKSGLFASLLTSLVALSATIAHAQDRCGPRADNPPLMTIKIFNDDPDHSIYPVLTTGKRKPRDIWLQSCFKIPQAEIDVKTFEQDKAYRLYINPNGKGIEPGEGITLRLPLYTQLVNNVDPTKPDQYIDWWNGSTLLLYWSADGRPPEALRDAVKFRPNQREVTSFADGSVLPKCPRCQPLVVYSDDSDLPKSDPSQLLEFTLGARVALEVKDPTTDPPNTLDLKNVDFDVSYVNIAHLPAVMGPFGNDQVGYVGSPKRIKPFRQALRQFLDDFSGWPQFIDDAGGNGRDLILKLPSPLEIFSRLGGRNPPPDLTSPPQWPNVLWPPIQKLRDNWIRFAGPSNKDAGGVCSRTANEGTFCDAILDVKRLLRDNYENYRAIFAAKCDGKPVELTDDLLILHVYGWTPFTEAEEGRGCPANANLLQKTPGYDENNYARYVRFKEEFDKLNYNTFQNPKYVFNPYSLLIHGDKYVGAPNVYAYSVDDAVGNIQAYATGFIVDVGSTKNLENRLPAAPPININYAIDGPNGVKLTSYRICVDDAAHERPVNPHFQSFVISANRPENCPIFFYDNKKPKQLYTFKLKQEPPFKEFRNPANARWTQNTAAPIDCNDNTGIAPYEPSSKTWCCDKSASNGVFAYSSPEPGNIHGTLSHFVITHAPEPNRDTANVACSGGQ